MDVTRIPERIFQGRADGRGPVGKPRRKQRIRGSANFEILGRDRWINMIARRTFRRPKPETNCRASTTASAGLKPMTKKYARYEQRPLEYKDPSKKL